MTNRNYQFGAEYDADAQGSPEVVDGAIFGELTARSEAQIVARGIPINQIWPDMAQPRRAIPARVRGQWDGNPAAVQDVLYQWGRIAEQEAGQALDPQRLLMSKDGIDLDGVTSPAALEWLDLLALGASILRDGLTNPVTVVQRGGRYVVETGERRLLAHHLLAQYADPNKYAVIAARIVDGRGSVWRQAAENGARRPLNAVGMARQLALLIMAMYDGGEGARFDEYDHLVLPGECDRRFYAQVANGKLYPVKRGFGQRVLDVTGLKSRKQVNHYRSLLDIPDEIWMAADAENWTEFRIRETIAAPNRPTPPAPESTPKMDDVSTAVDTWDQNQGVEGSERAGRPAAPESGYIPNTVGKSTDVAAWVDPDEDADAPVSWLLIEDLGLLDQARARRLLGYMARESVDDWVKREAGALLRFTQNEVNQVEAAAAFAEDMTRLHDAIKAQLTDELNAVGAYMNVVIDAIAAANGDELDDE